ncbi:MAG: hypothetical protein KKB30_05415 [Proteobacteria bacterium]|nr:hypothetical protein [Pseudomonadota bacterium]MBU1716138.1 hypothetical protein [Pseudomonadota bacterium]
MKNIAEIDHLLAAHPKDATCFGYCADCNEVHYLTEGNSRKYALELMAELEEHKRIDFHSQDPEPLFSTDCLWEKRGGQMFGVLECVDGAGNTVVLRAFSGQFNTRWQAEGWVPPAFDLDGYSRLMAKIEAVVQQMTDDIEACQQKADQDILKFEEAMRSSGLAAQKDYRRQRKEALKALALAKKKRRTYSQSMMSDFRDLYQLQNFKGNQRSILNVFYEDRGIPTGTGDCCAPKLIHHAARNGLTPRGLSEFYFGRVNKASTRFHKEFYPGCKNKCQPILGYMLCGL